MKTTPRSGEGDPVPSTEAPRSGLGAKLARWRTNPDLSKTASLNAVAAGLDYAARTIVELVLTPLMVSGLGDYLYGAWRVLWRLTGYVWASSGRSAQALQWSIAQRQHSEDYEEKRRHVGSAVIVWLIFLPLLGALGAIGVWIAPVLLKTPPAYVFEIRVTTALLVADAIVLTLLTVPRSVLQGENLGYKRMGLSALLVFAGGALTGLALFLDTGIVGVAVANVTGTLLTGITFLVVTRRHVPWFGLAKPAKDTVKWFLGLSWWFTGWKVLMQLNTGGDILVLGFFGSVELVTVYALTKFVPEAIAALVSAVVQGVAPGLGGIIGAGKLDRAVKVRDELMGYTWLFVTVAGGAALLLDRSFLALWVGPGYYPGQLATWLIIVAAVQFMLIRNDAFIIDLTLELRSKVLIGVISTALSLGLAAVFVGPLDGGIIGLCLGMILGRSVLSVAYPRIVGRTIGQSFGSQVRGALRPGAVSLLVFVAMSVLSARVFVHSWLTLVLAAAVSAAILTGIVMFAGLSKTQRRFLWVRAGKLAGLAGGRGA